MTQHDLTLVGARGAVLERHSLTHGTRVSCNASFEPGGGTPETDGLSGKFFAPTVVPELTAEMPGARHKVVGAVLKVLTFRTVGQVVSLVRGTACGLAAGVWSGNIRTCLAFARRVSAGAIWTNSWLGGLAKLAGLAFGGMKQGGPGREPGGHGFEEFLEVKTVQMRIGNLVHLGFKTARRNQSRA